MTGGCNVNAADSQSSNNKITIIGSGITGLTTGALLSKQGFEVQVLEAHPQLLGGQARSFKASGFWFCAGPQYVWDFRPGGIGWRVLNYLGLERRVPFDPMDAKAFERCFIGNEEPIDIPMGLDNFQSMLVGKFPNERKGIVKFFKHVKDFFDGCKPLKERSLYRENALKMMSAILSASRLQLSAKMRTVRFRYKPLEKLFDYCNIPDRLRRIIYAHGGIFLENESTVSSICFGASTGVYHAGADYPRYGFRSLIDALADCIKEHGGTVEVNKCVIELEIERGRIVSGRCEDGELFHPDFVISNIAPGLISRLIENGAQLKYNITPSHTVISLFIGLEGYPGLSDMFNGRNIWWQDGKGEVEYREVDMTRSPRMLYVSSPSCNGTENRNDFPDNHSVIVFSPGSYIQAKQAFNQNIEEHEILREKIIEVHLDQLENRLLPKIRSYIKYIRVMTPYEIEQETFAEQGGVYGRRGTPKSLLSQPLSKTGVDNLCFACAATGAAGIASGMQTAAIIAEEMTGVKI
jgi:phytoene dehydrogenase-like protein